MRIKRNDKNYDKTLIKWIKTKQGTAVTLFIIEQLIKEFDVNAITGKINGAVIDDIDGITIDIEQMEGFGLK